MRRLRQRVGRRGAALLFFALLDLVYCFALLNPPQPLTATYVWMTTLTPLWVCALCWGAVGMLCLVSAFLEQDTPAFVGAVALKIGWGLFTLFGWMADAVDRGYVSAVIWLAFAAFVYLIAGGIPAAPPRRGRT
ncbi:hypothetical protein AB0M54_24265 [Actinoplanes sp. NPDC051470]|uniref:hypothetical protein n=1 Tax=Actinoplanes sp. NPDC051470 TaxID=3157224 RepID=UPI003440230D